jgi:uncharacterized protein
MALRLTDELFVVPYEGEYLIYAPLIGSVVKVTALIVKDLQMLDVTGEVQPKSVRESLLQAKIVINTEEKIKESDQKSYKSTKGFTPTSVTLFPTFDCNLRCIYCYSNAGIQKEVMPDRIAEAAIRMVVDNAVKLKTDLISLGFHGGGEPFYGAGWHLMQNAVAFTRKIADRHGLRLRVISATNGVLSEAQLEWMRENLDSIHLSIDGPPDIQDAQRPLVNGFGSSVYVERTIAFMERHKYPYGIRSTLTRDSVRRMPEIIKYFRSVTTLKRFHLEPLFECGRCATSKACAPEQPEFAQLFFELLKDKVTQAVKVIYSGYRFGPINKFCGACSDNFVVTPLGNVTSCFEVSYPSDPRAGIFFIGSYDSDKNIFRIDGLRRKILQSRIVQALPHCTNCFAKYNCAGDCPAKSALSGDLFDTSTNVRCSTNRLLTIHQIAGKLSEKKEGR